VTSRWGWHPWRGLDGASLQGGLPDHSALAEHLALFFGAPAIPPDSREGRRIIRRLQRTFERMLGAGEEQAVRLLTRELDRLPPVRCRKLVLHSLVTWERAHRVLLASFRELARGPGASPARKLALCVLDLFADPECDAILLDAACDQEVSLYAGTALARSADQETLQAMARCLDTARGWSLLDLLLALLEAGEASWGRFVVGKISGSPQALLYYAGFHIAKLVDLPRLARSPDLNEETWRGISRIVATLAHDALQGGPFNNLLHLEENERLIRSYATALVAGEAQPHGVTAAVHLIRFLETIPARLERSAASYALLADPEGAHARAVGPGRRAAFQMHFQWLRQRCWRLKQVGDLPATLRAWLSRSEHLSLYDRWLLSDELEAGVAAAGALVVLRHELLPLKIREILECHPGKLHLLRAFQHIDDHRCLAGLQELIPGVLSLYGQGASPEEHHPAETGGDLDSLVALTALLGRIPGESSRELLACALGDQRRAIVLAALDALAARPPEPLPPAIVRPLQRWMRQRSGSLARGALAAGLRHDLPAAHNLARAYLRRPHAADLTTTMLILRHYQQHPHPRHGRLITRAMRRLLRRRYPNPELVAALAAYHHRIFRRGEKERSLSRS
jgi:hypothetical protein